MPNIPKKTELHFVIPYKNTTDLNVSSWFITTSVKLSGQLYQLRREDDKIWPVLQLKF